MRISRLAAILLVFGGVSFAWMILGTSVWTRTSDLDHSLSAGMAITIDGQAVPVRQSDVTKGRVVVPVDRRDAHVVGVAYATGGQNAWYYAPRWGMRQGRCEP